MRHLWILLFLAACAPSPTEYRAIEISDSIGSETTAEALISPYRDSLTQTMETILVVNEKSLTRGIPESTLGNLIADLLLERALLEMPDSIRPLVCLINIGGLRVDLPKGPITVGKVFELMPFENEIDVIKLSPEKIKEMLNYLQEVGGQPISGIKFKLNSNSDELLFEDGSVNLEDYVYVVTSDYLSEGGDKMKFFLNPEDRIRTGIKIRDAIIDDFRLLGLTNQTLNSELDGRISVIKF